MRVSRRPLFDTIRQWHESSGAFALFLVALGLAASWTLVGVLLSLQQGVESFLREFLLFQGPPLLSLGFFLCLFGRWSRLAEVAKALECLDQIQPLGRAARAALMLFVTVVGSSSLLSLGFPSSGLQLAFMRFTCFFVCLLASAVTIHAVEILRFTGELPNCSVALHSYSPSETPALRRLAEYAAAFGLATTLGYCFALIGTLTGEWTADPRRVRAVVLFWPIIYVPLSCAILAYPHVAIYRTIRNRKDMTISGLQAKMTELTSHNLTNEDIERLNGLADLIKKIQETPNYPRDMSLLGTLALTILANLASLLVPKEALGQALRTFMGF